MRPTVFLGMLGVVVLVSCAGPVRPRVKVEPVTFDHPEEIVRGTGEAEGYWVLADRRTFAVLAFLNVMGFDEEAPGMEMHPIRVKVRERVAARLASHPDKPKEWRAYYEPRRMWFGQYVNWSLSLSSDHPFRRIRPREELLYDWTDYQLADFPDVLNDFWTTANLEEVWRECWPELSAMIRQYSVPRMAEEMDFLWRYLRMPRKDSFTIIHEPVPLSRHNQASGHRFENYFYSLDGPGSNGGGLNVHEYLHTFVNDIVKASMSSQEPKLRRYFEAGKDAAISASYPDFFFWTCECLVHALDHRITVLRVSDPAIRSMVEARVDRLTRDGYTLLLPLYLSLADFEASDVPFDRYLPVLFERLPDPAAPR